MTDRPSNWLPQLSAMEWAPVLFSWITLWYFFLNLISVPKNEMRLDPLPVLSGVGIIPFVWVAIRLAGRVENAVVELRNDASLAGDQNVDDLLDDIKSTVRKWAIGGMALVSTVCGAGTFYAMFSQNSAFSFGADWVKLFLPPIMIGVGGLLGFILGRLAGYGNLFTILERRQFRLAGLSTAKASEAMRSVGGVYAYAIVATTSICGFCASWWVIWHLGFDPGFYREIWQTPYAAIWATALVFFVLCGWRPVRTFNQRLDRIYGGADARRSIDEMLQQAREDLAALAKAPAEQSATDETELRAFVASLQARSFRSPLTSERVCLFIALANVIVFGAPVLLGQRLPGGM